MDRISVRVEFKKFIWLCPSCKQEDIEDARVGGGNDYTHTCLSCGAKFNQSGPNMKEYNGCLQYPYNDYPVVKQEDIDLKKATLCEKWLYDWKNPPPYIEPTKEELERQIADKQAEIAQLESQIQAKEATIGD